MPRSLSDKWVAPPTDCEVAWRLRARDLMKYLKLLARGIGLVHSLRVPDELTVVKGFVDHSTGWSSYAFAVPAKGTLRVTLKHPNEAWFRLMMMDKNGKLE